jgi:hypothetical protein
MMAITTKSSMSVNPRARLVSMLVLQGDNTSSYLGMTRLCYVIGA